MCVIAYKEATTGVPKPETFAQCFSRNNDGAGFMYAFEGQVHYEKGFQTYDDFQKRLDELLAAKPELSSCPMAFHFRIGTHGSRNSREHTHPFPISDRYNELTKLSGKNYYAAMHNGILTLDGFELCNRYSSGSTWNSTTYSWEEHEQPTESWSDTMEYVAKVLMPLSLIKQWMQYPAFKSIIDVTLGSSKLLIMNGDGAVQRYGKWYKSTTDGCYYSNESYIIPKKVAVVTMPQVATYSWINTLDEDYVDDDNTYWDWFARLRTEKRQKAVDVQKEAAKQKAQQKVQQRAAKAHRLMNFTPRLP